MVNEAGDVPDMRVSDRLTVTMDRGYAMILGKKLAPKLDSVAEAVKSVSALRFLADLKTAGIDLKQELDVGDEVVNFINTFMRLEKN